MNVYLLAEYIGFFAVLLIFSGVAIATGKMFWLLIGSAITFVSLQSGESNSDKWTVFIFIFCIACISVLIRQKMKHPDNDNKNENSDDNNKYYH